MASTHASNRGRRVKPLTAAKVDKITKPGRHADGGGLYLFVKPDGRKSWVFRWRDRETKKLREAGLGSYTNERVSLKMARERADHYRDQVWQGLDPIAERHKARRNALQAASDERTFAKCAKRYIDVHEASWRNDKHASQWRNTLETYGKPISDMPVADITTDDVLRCLEPIWTDKTETATRVRQRIESVLDWATARKYRAGANPARWKGHLDKLLPKPTRLKRVRHQPALDYRDVGDFIKKLRAIDTQGARAVEFQILTATRPGEVVAAKWHEFDFKRKVWTIPGERMKAGKEHSVPLSKRAIAIIEAQPRASEFVFPGIRLNKPMSTATGLKTVKGINSEITAHGFRSTFRDWAAEQTAYPREVIEHAMAHHLKDKAEAAYFRSNLLDKRKRLMRDWARHCQRPAEEHANVARIRRAR